MLDAALHVLTVMHPLLLLKIIKNMPTNKLRLYICYVMKVTEEMQHWRFGWSWIIDIYL